MIDILKSITQSNRSLAILIDPEKMDMDAISAFAKAITSTITALQNELNIDQLFFFVGGSTMENVPFNSWMKILRESTNLPIVIFPGSHNQLSEHAHGLLFTNLLSGRNPDYLIEQQFLAAQKLKNTNLEILPTGYLLIDGGKETAVQNISKTQPLHQSDVMSIVNHAFTAQLMGNLLVYLEAGSGAIYPVSITIVQEVSQQLKIPVIVGGGLRTIEQIEDTYRAGAKMVVIGTAIEQDIKWNG
ncbi:geranylgeranylglyceryl/heptaprenylglyceryl phosphate synthase [Nonlabens dokdonensis]|uniref:Geranylgeranylglyceryl/heptaprenylglyceryl phosphate synthase n=1 Tax=Nonlabens dokdonensis TaxID=328515 RepID=A0A1Z8AVP2_9FLAO|nr:geranylgeranylglyceryl/heptaprenylglyceryl phosphate synthase [Nonlabens dokdonensis]OUS14268.1 geranylgeranylglyceryl/heptaprenylglyceryl phosphate synthase [Nonlabens dokdonensis]